MTGGPKTQTPDCKCYLASAFQHNPFPHNDRFLPIQGQLAYPDTPAFWRRFRPLDGESRPLFTHGIAGLSCQILHHRLIPIRGEKNNMESRAFHLSCFFPHFGQLCTLPWPLAENLSVLTLTNMVWLISGRCVCVCFGREGGES